MDDSDLKIPGYSNVVSLSSGSSGAVYAADDTRHGRRVAIKVLVERTLDATVRESFDRELSTMGRLGDHPNIVAVHDSGFTEDGLPYFVMPLFPNGSFADRVADQGTLPWTEAADVAVRILSALETAHQQQTLHRDIKPANLFVGPFRNQAMLGDFGISTLLGTNRTATNAIAYTLHYVAPEVLDGEKQSHLSDIYSFGATLYQLLSGRPPFEADTTSAIIQKILTADLPDPSNDAPAAFNALIAKMLARQPQDRPASALEAAEAVQAIQREANVDPTPVAVNKPDAVVSPPQAALETITSIPPQDSQPSDQSSNSDAQTTADPSQSSPGGPLSPAASSQAPATHRASPSPETAPSQPTHGQPQTNPNQPTHGQPAYGQPPTNPNQPTHGQPAYGQPPTNPNQPAFGQPQTNPRQPAFGQPPTNPNQPAFGQPPTNPNQPAFGQPPTNPRQPAFGQPPTNPNQPAFGQPPTHAAGPPDNKRNIGLLAGVGSAIVLVMIAAVAIATLRDSDNTATEQVQAPVQTTAPERTTTTQVVTSAADTDFNALYRELDGIRTKAIAEHDPTALSEVSNNEYDIAVAQEREDQSLPPFDNSQATYVIDQVTVFDIADEDHVTVRVEDTFEGTSTLRDTDGTVIEEASREDPQATFLISIERIEGDTWKLAEIAETPRSIPGTLAGLSTDQSQNHNGTKVSMFSFASAEGACIFIKAPETSNYVSCLFDENWAPSDSNSSWFGQFYSDPDGRFEVYASRASETDQFEMSYSGRPSQVVNQGSEESASLIVVDLGELTTGSVMGLPDGDTLDIDFNDARTFWEDYRAGIVDFEE